MTLLKKIRKYGDSILRQQAEPIQVFDIQLESLINEMLEVLCQDGGIGLAAPQIGVSKQVIVVDTGQDKMALINPEIVKKSKDKSILEEGCLSLPGILVNVPRPISIKVKGLDIKGKEVEFNADHLLSKVLQHEIDHLKGKLIIDYLPWWKKWRTIRKLKKNIRNQE